MAAKIRKTIRMPKKYLTRWLNALRGGAARGYEQAKGALYIEDDKTFCCLGVLQHCITGGVEYESDLWGNAYPMSLPSKEWLKDYGITFKSALGTVDNDAFFPGSLCNKPYGMCASSANDEYNMSFAQIADMIEQVTETY